nr:uncharacterized protein K02A2.6-like [Quercus suber]
MPFGLKNAGATYQRLMNKMFTWQIGRNVQVYIDDMLVKSRREKDHLKDLEETFDTLRSYNMKLNSGKWAFRVTAGKFLGFMVSQKGIEANPDKIRAIVEMAPPKNVKEVQSLNGKIAALNRQAEGVGVVLQSPEGDMVECMVRLEFLTTNNEAEYEALITGLDLAKAAGVERVVIYCDFQVVVNQELGPQSDWIASLVSYLKNGILPDGKEAARKLKVQATRFVLIRDVLYKRGFSCPYLRCVGPEEAGYIMREVHKGICENHSGSRSLVHKLVRTGYFWPTMQKDAETYVKACNKCQRFSNVIRQPLEELTPMMAPWPFAQWGLDIMGPFPTAIRQLKFLVVGIDYFTKWVEAEALATITEKNVRSFIWRCIICRFGIPKVLVSDNGKQFDNDSFRDFCSQLGIRNHYSSPADPQANGQVEVTN